MEKMIKLFDALSDITRLRLYLLLSQGNLCVCELVNILKIEQSRISHGLKILKEANLIKNKRQGNWMIYSVNQKFENNKFIQGLREEIKLYSRDLNNFNKCKKEKIRETRGKNNETKI